MILIWNQETYSDACKMRQIPADVAEFLKEAYREDVYPADRDPLDSDGNIDVFYERQTELDGVKGKMVAGEIREENLFPFDLDQILSQVEVINESLRFFHFLVICNNETTVGYIVLKKFLTKEQVSRVKELVE